MGGWIKKTLQKGGSSSTVVDIISSWSQCPFRIQLMYSRHYTCRQTQICAVLPFIITAALKMSLKSSHSFKMAQITPGRLQCKENITNPSCGLPFKKPKLVLDGELHQKYLNSHLQVNKISPWEFCTDSSSSTSGVQSVTPTALHSCPQAVLPSSPPPFPSTDTAVISTTC